MLWGFLAGGLLLAGCQLPLGQKSQGFRLTLAISQPSVRGIEASRVLLPTASKVTLTVASAGKILDTQTVSTAGQPNVTFTLKLPPLATYDLKAEAKDSSGTLVFAGSTTVQLLGDTSGTLNLLPVDAAGSLAGWTVVEPTPAIQPAGSLVTQSLTLAAGDSRSFRLNWGGASAFTFQTAAGLEIYLQTNTGSPLTLPTGIKAIAAASVPEGVWVTYYARSAPVTLTSLGMYTIPIQSLGLTGPSTVVTNGTGTINLAAGAVTPSNATETAMDFTWTTDRPDILTLGAATPSGVPFTASAVTGTAQVTATSKSNPTVTASWTVTVDPTGTVSATFTTTPWEDLDFGTAIVLMAGANLTVSTPNSILQTQGTAWEWVLDGELSDVSTEPLAWSTTFTNLTVGLHTLSVGVTVGAVRYSGTLAITVNPLEVIP